MIFGSEKIWPLYAGLQAIPFNDLAAVGKAFQDKNVACVFI